METLFLPVFAADEVVVLHDRDYLYWVLHRIRMARVRVLVAQFIVDIRPDADPHRDTLAVASAIAEAARRGVDVRVIVSRFESRRDALEPNRVFAQWLAARGGFVRTYRPREGSSRKDMHTKAVLVDDEWVVIGSHNWTMGAFGANHEQSVAVRSRDVAARLRSTLEGMWASSDELIQQVHAPSEGAPDSQGSA